MQARRALGRASAPSPIVCTSFVRRRINLKAEVTALNQRATCTAKVRSICRRRVQTVRQRLILPGPRRKTCGRQQRAAAEKSFDKIRRDCHSAGVVNTPGDRKRNGITYGGASSYGGVMAVWNSGGSRLVNGESAGESIIMFVRHALMTYGANWSPRRIAPHIAPV